MKGTHALKKEQKGEQKEGRQEEQIKNLRVEKILRIINGSGETPSEEELEVLCRIANLSEETEYDVLGQYKRLLKQLRRRRLYNRAFKILKPLGTVAASFLFGLLIWHFYLAPIDQEKSVERRAELVTPPLSLDTTNILLTLRNGAILHVPDAAKKQVTTAEEIRLLEKRMEDGLLASEYNTITVPKTKTYQITLDDGSVVSFNSETKVHFPSEFSSLERRIILEYGELFLQVAKEEKRPFIVETKGTEIEVLGTSFNINAYPEQPLTTTLVTGKVRVKREEKQLEITAGSQVVVDSSGNMDVRRVNTDNVVAWLKGLFLFKEVTLGEIITQLRRWYDVEILIDDPKLKDYTFTGVLERKEPIEYTLNLIEQTSDIQSYLAADGMIHLKRRK